MFQEKYFSRLSDCMMESRTPVPEHITTLQELQDYRLQEFNKKRESIIKGIEKKIAEIIKLPKEPYRDAYLSTLHNGIKRIREAKYDANIISITLILDSACEKYQEEMFAEKYMQDLEEKTTKKLVTEAEDKDISESKK